MLRTDTIHDYLGYSRCVSHCRVQVYTARGLPPLLVLTETLDNPGTSITNMIEHLAAGVSERYLTDDDTAGFDPPFRVVEHYERDASHRYLDRRLDWSLVTFSHYRPEVDYRNYRRKLGTPAWRYLSEQDVEKLLAPYCIHPTDSEEIS